MIKPSKRLTFKKFSASSLAEKSIISAQFIKVTGRLIQEGKFRDQEDFANHYGFDKNLLSHIKSGRQDVTIDLLYEVVLDWKIHPGFIFALTEQIYY